MINITVNAVQALKRFRKNLGTTYQWHSVVWFVRFYYVKCDARYDNILTYWRGSNVTFHIKRSNAELFEMNCLSKSVKVAKGNLNFQQASEPISRVSLRGFPWDFIVFVNTVDRLPLRSIYDVTLPHRIVQLLVVHARAL